MMRACVLDIFTVWENDRTIPVIHAKTENDETYAVRVYGTPWSIVAEVPSTFSDVDYLRNTVEANVDWGMKKGHCPRTLCECGKSDPKSPSFSYQPCKNLYKKTQAVTSIEFEWGFPYNGYNEHPRKFVRVGLREAYYSSFAMTAIRNVLNDKNYEIFNYENDPVLHFIDATAVLSHHVPKRETIRADTWFEFPFTPVQNGFTRDTYECVVNFTDLKVLPDIVTPVPMRLMTFDIETDTDGIKFPEPEKNEVYTITVRLDVGNTVKRCIISHLEPVEGLSFEFIKTSCERETLVTFRKWILDHRPDVISGHYIQGFDLPYLFSRAKHLVEEEPDDQYVQQLLRFRDFGVLKGYKARVHGLVRHKAAKVDAKKPQKAEKKGTATTTYFMDVPGRWMLDTKEVAMLREQLPGYTLKIVAREVLNDKKVEFPVTRTREYARGSGKKRKLFYVYNMGDTDLCADMLLKKWNAIMSFTKDANAAGCLARHIFSFGKTATLMRTFRAFGAAQRVYIPKHIMLRGNEDDEEEATMHIPIYENYHCAADYTLKTYEGAFVFECEPKFHDVPVATLDFNSMYPSIAIGNNLCSSVHVPTQYDIGKHPEHLEEVLRRHGLTRDDVFVGPNNDVFVKKSKRQGLLPMICQYLLEKRGEVKLELKKWKKENNEIMERIADARQNGLKVLGNSVYGGAGSRVSAFYDPAVSASTTLIGQQYIKAMDALINGRSWTYEGRTFVTNRVYGDTDSLMFRIDDAPWLIDNRELHAKLAWDVLEYLSAEVTKYGHENNVFPRNLKMGADKIMYPGAFFKKKMYAGRYYTVGQPPKNKVAGLQSEKRDSPEVSRVAQSEILRMMIAFEKPEAILSYTRQYIEKMLAAPMAPEMKAEEFDAMVEAWSGDENDLPEAPERDPGTLRVSDFFVSSKIKDDDDYSNENLAQLKVVKIWREFNKGTAPRTGDYVTYGYALIEKGAKMSAADQARPAYEFLEGKVQPDRLYYFDKRFKNGVATILSVILKPHEIKELLDETRYERIAGITTNPALFGKRTNEARVIVLKPSVFKRNYGAGAKRNADIRDSMVSDIKKRMKEMDTS